MSESRNAPSESVTQSPVAEVQRWTHGWRRLILTAGMLVYPVLALVGVAQYSTGTLAVVGYAAVAAFACCYVSAAFAAARGDTARFWPLLIAMTALFITTLPAARENAFFLCAVVVSMAAPVLRRRIAPIAVAAVLASILVPWAVPSWTSGPGWVQGIMVAFTVMLVYAFAEIARANHTLVEARAEVARLASLAERNRIARDIHDLVGHSLTAITVKSNLARQLAARERSSALKEITEVEELSRQALADMRAAVTGYREVSLAGELAVGRELLRASGITADLPTATEIVSHAHQELFGWTVREGITNVVRHAHATRCTVTVSSSQVQIQDDGVGGAEAAGKGLVGLRERVAAAGGRIEAGPVEPHGWMLRVSLGTATR